MENFLEEYSKLLDDSKNHLSNETIAMYLNLKDRLSRKEKKFIEKHLTDCSGCKNKYELIQREDEEIDTGVNVYIRKRRIPLYWYATAAMILIALGISYWFYLTPEKEQFVVKKENRLIPDTSSSIKDVKSPIEDKPKIEKDEPKYNEADFAVNKTLENFINRNIRSELGTKIISPAIGDTIKIPVKFEWKSVAEEFELSVVDNKNQAVFDTNTSVKSYLFDKETNPGVYYWKIFADGKLEAVGKFFIK